MKEEVRALIQEGLYQDNLLKLTRLCRALFSEAPTLYGTLLLICESFAQEYDNQAIPMQRYESIMKTIQPPLLLLLEDQIDPAIFVGRLDDVFNAFGVLKDISRIEASPLNH
jgi:phosphopentomutase